MDEPISHLDASLRARMREELEVLLRNLGVTTIYVTHDQVEALAMADRIAVMNLGKTLQIGTPIEIYERPQNDFVASFIGEPPMNFSLCDLVRENGQSCLKSASINVELDARLTDLMNKYTGKPQVKIGIRPEDVGVSLSPLKNSMPVAVEFTEPQGERTILTLRLAGGESYLVEVAADFIPEVDTPLHMTFNLSRLHIFDLESGNNLIHHS